MLHYHNKSAMQIYPDLTFILGRLVIGFTSCVLSTMFAPNKTKIQYNTAVKFFIILHEINCYHHYNIIIINNNVELVL